MIRIPTYEAFCGVLSPIFSFSVVSFSVVAFSLVAFSPSSVDAQQGTVDFLSESDAAITSATAIIERSKGSVEVKRAQITEVPDSSRLLLSAAASSGRSAIPRFGVAFITNPISVAPPVTQWSAEKVLLNTLSEETLTRDTLDLDSSIEAARLRSVELQDALSEHESELAEKLDVQGIREILEEQRELRRSISEQQRDIARLEQLIEEGRSLEAPENINGMRLELADHLRQAAQVTAAADRLSRRKLEAARKRLQAKLKIIEELKKEDPAELARSVLELRKERRSWENRLGITSRDNDQF